MSNRSPEIDCNHDNTYFDDAGNEICKDCGTWLDNGGVADNAK